MFLPIKFLTLTLISNLFPETPSGVKCASVDISHLKIGWEITSLPMYKHTHRQTHTQTHTHKLTYIREITTKLNIQRT